jgi:hypothetical protein
MISADEFDARFDAGEDMTAYLDLSSARRPGREVQRVNVDFPIALLRAIDAEAGRLGVTRQAFIKIRIADSLHGVGAVERPRVNVDVKGSRDATVAEAKGAAKRMMRKHRKSLERLARRD